MKRVIALLSLVLLLNISNVHASDIKITLKESHKNDMQSYVMSAKKNKKKIWTWKSRKHPATELASVTYITKGNYVYIFEDGYLVILKKNNGQRVLNKKNKYIHYSTVGAVDDKRNIYTIGFYDKTLYKFNSKGKKLYSKKIKGDSYWPSRIYFTKDKVKIDFDHGKSATFKK